MAHGPEINSDLSFEMFLEAVMEFNGDDEPGRKGMKLDFKGVDAIEPVLQILLANGASEFPYPIWFNADILRGPINAISIPIHAATFLSLTTQNLPEATLSTGWKTRFGDGGPVEGSYSREQMDEMMDLLISHNVSYSTPVTYPIRTGLGTQSIRQIVYLLERSARYWEDSTITLWHGGEDPAIDLIQLDLLIETIGKDRCFADIGIDLRQ